MKIESEQSILPSPISKCTSNIVAVVKECFVDGPRNLMIGRRPTPRIEDPVQLFTSLCLPENLIKLLFPALKELGFTVAVDEGKVKKPVDDENIPITVIKSRNWHGWFANIDKAVLRPPRNQDEHYKTAQWWIMLTLGRAFAQYERLFILSEKLTKSPSLNATITMEQELGSKGICWRYIPWDHVELLQQSYNKIDPIQYVKEVKKVFRFEASPVSPTDLLPEEKNPIVKVEGKIIMPKPTQQPPDYIEKIVEIMTQEAMVSQRGSDGFFHDLVHHAILPDQFKIERQDGWTSNAAVNARDLVDWALAKGGNPADPRFTTLGSLLHKWLPSLGLENSRWIAAIIVAYQLYRDNVLKEDLAVYYGIPLGVSHAKGEAVDFGPDIDWQGPREQLELQGWFTPEPDFQDVGFLMRAIQRASSVCRIEIKGSKRTGTGVLIGKRYVLTNYHVLKDEKEPKSALQINAQKVILRFGKITKSSGQEATGQEFKLDIGKPILQASPVNQLDYALLHVQDSIQDALKSQKNKDAQIEPAPFTLDLPDEKMELHILQHPEGDSMKLAQSGDGVVKVLENKGLVQYTTRTLGGSSGSPCFTSDWKMIALHHAQRSKSFGVIREGIIFKSIFKEIEEFLK